MQRMTRQRRAVLDELGAQESFRSAQQVHDHMSFKHIKVGLATVYRNLQDLADAGDVDTILAEDGETLYRLCQEPSHHHHLICDSCGKVEEIAPGEVESWVRDVSSEHGFTLLHHSIEIFGLCAVCQNEQLSQEEK